MKWVNNLLERVKKHYLDKRTKEPAAKKWMDGNSAFEIGTTHFVENRFQDALDCFDHAIDCGFEMMGIYNCRGQCLHRLGYALDAIDDFTKAIELEPEDCNLYYSRSSAKGRAGDSDGEISDLQEAIRLSRADNDYTRISNSYAQEKGWPNVTAMYQDHLAFALARAPDTSMLARETAARFREEARAKRRTRNSSP